MNKYEQLVSTLDNDIIFDDMATLPRSYDGIYSSIKGDKVILISDRIRTTTERRCILAEEIGHYKTTVGDILNSKLVKNRKLERSARAYAYEQLLPLDRIVSAFLCGCDNAHETAEFAEITEEFLYEALAYYKDKYGVCVRHDDFYVVYFDPLCIRMSFDD